LALALRIQVSEQVLAGFRRVEQAQHGAVATAGGRGLLAGEQVAPGAVGNGSQPTAKAARRLVLEGAHLPGPIAQEVLGDVLRVGLLEAPLAAPGVDLAAVTLHELTPSLLVVRC